MDRPKLLGICSTVSVLLCLFMTVVSLFFLQDLTEDSRLQRENLQLLVQEFESFAKDQNTSTNTDGSISTSTGAAGTTAESESTSFCIKAVNGKIGIYTADGYLVRLLDLDVATLPQRERQALEKGISMNSWQELLALLQDYGA
ncbi:MAG: hypothetical protein IJX62_01860 [Clostridia bacterium]|nr:hypothetical protein [Clostridia bacterium]